MFGAGGGTLRQWRPLYCSLRPRTAAAEVDHLIARQPVPIRTPRVTHRLSITLAKVADLRNLGALESCGIASEMVKGEDLAAPQLVGGAVNWLQCAGMLVPSARDAGDNLVVFVTNMGPNDAVEPVSEELYSLTDRGGR